MLCERAVEVPSAGAEVPAAPAVPVAALSAVPPVWPDSEQPGNRGRETQKQRPPNRDPHQMDFQKHE